MIHPEGVLQMLINATRLLASNADVQVSAFPPFVVVADELALNFDDMFRLTDQLVESGHLSQQQLKALERVENILDELSNRGDSRLWTLEALRENPEWQRVRVEALKALEALGVGPGPASLEGITYIEGGPKKAPK